MEKVIIKAQDGYNLNIHLFEVNNSKGYVQVIHGMEEHQERYEELAYALNDFGYTVVTSNLRGHGDDAPLLGFFKEKRGYDLLLDDQKRITSYIKKKYHTKKIILFAHSMGTIISRNLMQTETEDYEKIILSGYPCPQPGTKIAILLANIVKKFKGPRNYSNFLKNISVGKFNKQIKNPKTSLDWLSFSEQNVKNYIDDKYCGHGFTTSAYADLFYLLDEMTKYKKYKIIDKKVPILLIRGEDDPCTGFDKGSKKSKIILQKAGYSNISEIKYDNMRHEILQETNKRVVINDIISFVTR